MSSTRPIKVGEPTIVAAVTASTANKALGNSNARFLVIYNSGSNAAFINTGKSDIGSIVFPTTSVAQNGAIIPPGFQVSYEKNNSSDTHIAYICDTGLTTTLYIQSGEGV